ncbi:MAG: hypothetical protein WC627_06020 [Legionella sp.]|jgi:hypothetical protein
MQGKYTLAKMDYYHRDVQEDATAQAKLEPTMSQSRQIIYDLIPKDRFIGRFDPTVNGDIDFCIMGVQARLDKTPEDAELKNTLILLNELKKLNSIKCISIPHDDGSVLSYCELQVPTTGVTTKIALIKQENLLAQLTRLNQTKNLTKENYLANAYLLKMDAILKLPKHGDVVEVQREALALNLSRMLELRTTQSIFLRYNGEPALFIPFESIESLDQHTTGASNSNATINPVSLQIGDQKPDGLQADTFISDFGNALGLLYLCNDPDAIGKNCQNKALIDSEDLYIFDQVVKPTTPVGDFFSIDSRLNMQTSLTGATSRHTVGRNKSIIEDSNLPSKYSSLFQLHENKDRIFDYIGQVIANLTAEENTADNEQLKIISKLKEDAITLQTNIHDRIFAIKNFTRPGMLHILILEKLLNHPVLFTKDGRPYRNPWTESHLITPYAIRIQADSVIIHFSGGVSKELCDFIKAQGIESLTLSGNTITIDKEDLYQLKETMLYPEADVKLQAINYLDKTNLAITYKAYACVPARFFKNTASHIENIISEYHNQIAQGNVLGVIQTTEKKLHELLESTDNQGLVKHITKKFYFDAQIQLQKLMGNNIPDKLNDAFTAAARLDRMSQFHEVVLKACSKNMIQSPQFSAFLDFCIEQARSATNSDKAQTASTAIFNKAHNNNWLQVPNPLAALSAGAEAGILTVDSVRHLQRDLEQENAVLTANKSRPVNEVVQGEKQHVDDTPISTNSL